MHQCPPGEANSSAGSQDIFRILWNTEGPLPHLEETATCVSILSQINPVHASDPIFGRLILIIYI
jgi:hypothetical protein